MVQHFGHSYCLPYGETRPTTGCFKKSQHSWETITSYSETTNLVDLKLWLQGVLMSTPCCRISTPNRLVVSEYEVTKVLVSQECELFFKHPVCLSGNPPH